MARNVYADLSRKIRQAIAEKPARDALYTAMKRGRDARDAALTELPGGDSFRHEIRAIKESCLDRQDELLPRFVANAKKRGASVFLAEDGAAAVAYVLALAKKHGAKTVAKSKSLTSEEIEINQPLEAAGLDVIETDLGERIIQLAGEKPFHLVFPAVHKTAAQVAEIFRAESGGTLAVPDDPAGIIKVVRRLLRPVFLNADIGMTGANVCIADTGAIVIETNEGNARLVSSIPDIHVCITGREKVVETVGEALKMALAHPISAVGQRLTTYVTLMAGRSPLGDGANLRQTEGENENERQTHIIILDNGRSRMRADPMLRDALNCIRCGACMNICPTYGVVGGHTFGHIYPGPIGIPWTAAVHGLEKAGDFAPLCISCGLCKEICPAEIDIPMMIAEVKRRDIARRPEMQPAVNKHLMQVEAIARLGSLTAPLANRLLANGAFRWLLEKTIGIDRRRALPPFARATLAQRFRHRNKTRKPGRKASPAHRVVFFADIYAQFNAPELGMKVIETLEAHGCEVALPPQRSSGYPYLAYGALDRARALAAFNVRWLAPYARAGYDIVASEPTAAYCLKVSYPKMLGDSPAAGQVAARTFELFEYLIKLEDEATIQVAQEDGERLGQHPTALALPSADELAGRRFGFHISCHQRPLGSGGGAIEWLRRRGAEVERIETGTCCGMAGTFGLKAGALGYELSQAVGEPLFELCKRANVEAIVTESSVCSIQLGEGTGLEVWHPLMLLDATAAGV